MSSSQVWGKLVGITPAPERHHSVCLEFSRIEPGVGASGSLESGARKSTMRGRLQSGSQKEGGTVPP